MMKPNVHNNNLRFLSGGGETGELILNNDWTNSPLGNIETWPESLCTTLGIMLHSAFPMFLFWGEDLTCFYNDAFRPSLGINGKHPAIGKKGEEVWAEIWDFIGPMINGVMTTANPVWFEDQLVPFYRNGKIEDIYWTFSYSAAYNSDGKANGVVVTCTETTKTVLTKKKLEESERNLRSMIKQAPVSIGIFRGKDYITEMANARALELWGRKEEDVLNKPILEAIPELKEQGIKELLDDVYKNGRMFSAPELPVQIFRNGKMEKAYINFTYEPMYDPEGNIDGIMTVGTEVTDQVAAHKKVEKNEEKLNVVIDASELGTFELDLTSDALVCSKRFKEIFGYDNAKEVNHTFFLSHLLPDDIAVRDKAFLNALKTGILAYQSRIRIDNNSIRWIEVKGKIFYDEDRKPTWMIGTCGDITLEKQNRRDLEESEKKFRLLADSMPQHIWTADTSGNLNYFNQSVFDYSGLTLQQINEGGWIQIVHPDDKEKNIAAWLESIHTGKDFLFEHRFRKYDGTYRWQLSRALSQKDEQGNIDMWVGTSTDIQEQKDFASELEKQVGERTAELIKVNKTLKESEERYHLMVAEVQDYAILYLDRQGIVQNWNIGAEKIKGYKAEEIIGKSFSNFYTDADRKNQLPQKLLKLAEQNARAVQEGWRVKKDGSLFWASVVITAVHNNANEVIGFSKVTHDLTYKKEADDILMEKKIELEQKNSELEKMNKELQSFAYISSHDLQEPLRKIQTFASRIIEKEKDNLSESGIDLFSRMQRSAERMQALIDDLLAYSRTHTLERDFEKVNMNDIIQKVILDLKEEIQQKDATIHTKKTCELNIIPFQFQQLFYNLISNSLKFSKPGITLILTINSEYEKGENFKNEGLIDELNYCHISVEDNGIGFEPQYAQRIFELFQRLHGKEQYAGTGIGLAIVKKIVDNHDGIITASGEPGKGARFDIFIPVMKG
ncbi:MAG: PAS domain S-box protein [Ferruginibacter sp.]